MKKLLLFSFSVCFCLVLSEFDAKGQELTFDVSSVYESINANTPFADYVQGGITVGGGASGSVARVDGDFRYIEIGKGTAKNIIITSSNPIKKITIAYRGGGNDAEANPTITYGVDATTVTGVYADNTLKAGRPGTEKSFVFPSDIKYIKISNGVVASVNENSTTRVYKIIAGFSEYTLPLDILSFTAKPDALGKSVILNWQTTNEVNTKEFIVEKRTEHTEFTAIGTKASNNTAGIHNYSYTDNNAAPGHAYYRLKQVDKDGEYSYSDIEQVNIQAGLSLSVYPVPADKVLNVSHAAVQNAFIKILNAEGKVFLVSAVANGATATSVDISKLQKGVYFLIFDDGNKQLRQKFLKN